MSSYKNNPIKNKRREFSQSGLTMIELVIGFAIGTIMVIIVGFFLQRILSIENFFNQNYLNAEETQVFFHTALSEIRSAGQSSIGGYPIETASSTSFVFYSDIDGDGIFERIRYFLSGDIIKKGILKPTGNPFSYNPANEKISEAVHNVSVSSSSIFYYYDTDYTGAESALSYPITTTNIRAIEVKISSKTTPGAPEMFIKLTPRNLRTNI